MHCPTVPYPTLNMKQVKKDDIKYKFLFTTTNHPISMNLYMFIKILLFVKSTIRHI